MAKKRAKAIELLDEAEVGALLRACNRRAPTGARNAALVAVLYGAGLRVSEALALKPRDVDLDRSEINVREAKGSRPRHSMLFPSVAPYVERWLDKRTALGVTGHRPLFCTVTRGKCSTGAHGGGELTSTEPGQPVSRQYVGTMLARLGSRAGLAKRLHPHGLRHAHAAALQRQGCAYDEIQKQLGHEHLQTTFTYLAELTNGEALDRLRSRNLDVDLG